MIAFKTIILTFLFASTSAAPSQIALDNEAERQQGLFCQDANGNQGTIQWTFGQSGEYQFSCVITLWTALVEELADLAACQDANGNPGTIQWRVGEKGISQFSCVTTLWTALVEEANLAACQDTNGNPGTYQWIVAENGVNQVSCVTSPTLPVEVKAEERLWPCLFQKCHSIQHTASKLDKAVLATVWG